MPISRDPCPYLRRFSPNHGILLCECGERLHGPFFVDVAPQRSLRMGISRSTDVEMSIDGFMQMATISAIGAFAFPTCRRWSAPTQLRWPITFANRHWPLLIRGTANPALMQVKFHLRPTCSSHLAICVD